MLIIRFLIKLMGFVIAVLVIYIAVTALQVWLTSRHSDPHKAQAIVVMGSAQYDGVPSPDLAARLKGALGLWQEKLAPYIVVTGYKEPGDVYTEAEASADYLEKSGVPAASIFQVGGINSWQNLYDADQVLKEHSFRDILLVTDGFHEDRSLAIASHLGLDPSPVPAVDSPIKGWPAVPYFAKETLGVALGRVIGYQNLDAFHLDSKVP